MFKNKKKFRIIIMLSSISYCLLFFVLGLISCRKLVNVDPPVTSLTSTSVFADDATAASVLTGIYAKLSSAGILALGSVNGISLKCGLSADELTLFGGATNSNKNLVRFYTNSLNNSGRETFWETFYSYIYTTNVTIEKLTNSTEITPSVKKQLLGEAKFVRGFMFFYLVSLWGDVPLVTSSDYRINATISRSSIDEVFKQIISDLSDAKESLSSEYLDGSILKTTSERVRPNKWSAAALLSRVYLYRSDWTKAEVEATEVISRSSIYDTTSLNNVFLKNSKEAIWQLQPVNTGWNTEDARVFVLTGAPNASKPVFLSNYLLQAFEPGDQRKISWVGNRTVGTSIYQYPNKYKSATSGASLTEYCTILRLAEQYLIRAEARAKQNNIVGAVSDLNVIRIRARLSPANINDKDILLTAIMHERQVELFSEWGHRWLDLKRNEKLNEIMPAICLQKGGIWNSNWSLYPIPQSEIFTNQNIEQNTGY